MKDFFKKNKVLLIFMGVVYLILALFFVSAYPRAVYEVGREESEYHGKNPGSVAFSFLKDPRHNPGGIFKASSAYGDAMKIFSLVYLGIFAYMVWKIAGHREYESIEHGSADWCDDREKYSILSPKEGMILAEKTYLPVLPKPPEGKNGNIMVLGGSGAGKSASFVIPNALQLLGSYVFTDPKGELYDRTAGFFKHNGYDVHVINLQDPRYSDGYNPLSHIRGTLDVDTIVKIVSKKEGGDRKSSDPFWDQTSEALLKAVIYYILLNRPPEEHSIASCLAL